MLCSHIVVESMTPLHKNNSMNQSLALCVHYTSYGLY
jgi:hypothetical protein